MLYRQRSTIGKEGEELVACYLVQQGFTILERNYRKIYGEIDIIAAHDNLIIFVEVKTRRACSFDFSCVITPTKQRKIALVAREYITRHTEKNKVFRFDVALVEGVGPSARVIHITNAFVDQKL